MSTYLPNPSGIRLLRCEVSVEKQPPKVTSKITRIPIIAFIVDEQKSLTPVLISGPLKSYWRELRASVNGAYVFGIEQDAMTCITTGYESAELASTEAFTAWSEHCVAQAVAKVRREKGWPEETLAILDDDIDEESTAS